MAIVSKEKWIEHSHCSKLAATDELSLTQWFFYYYCFGCRSIFLRLASYMLTFYLHRAWPMADITIQRTHCEKPNEQWSEHLTAMVFVARVPFWTVERQCSAHVRRVDVVNVTGRNMNMSSGMHAANAPVNVDIIIFTMKREKSPMHITTRHFFFFFSLCSFSCSSPFSWGKFSKVPNKI